MGKKGPEDEWSAPLKGLKLGCDRIRFAVERYLWQHHERLIQELIKMERPIRILLQSTK